MLGGERNELNASTKSMDSYGIRRIATAVLLGIMMTAYVRAFDFWPIGFAGPLRTFLDLAGPLIFLAVIVTLLVWFVSAMVSLFRHNHRRAVGSAVAILSAPACCAMLLNTPLSDPWLWYVILNKSGLESEAANRLPPADSKYVVLEERDISAGIAGVSANHFVALIYSTQDPDTLASSIDGLSHIFGNFYRRDEFL